MAKSTDKPEDQLTQPKLSDKCGAYALTAAIGALQVIPLSEDTDIQFMGNKETLKPGDTFAAIAGKIYTLSGILNPARLYNPSADELVIKNGYNSPAALGSAAVQLGKKAWINITAEGKKDTGDRERADAGLKYRIDLTNDGTCNNMNP